MGSFIASVVFALLVATVCLLIGDCGADARLLISPTVGSALSRPGAKKKLLFSRWWFDIDLKQYIYIFSLSSFVAFVVSLFILIRAFCRFFACVCEVKPCRSVCFAVYVIRYVLLIIFC